MPDSHWFLTYGEAAGEAVSRLQLSAALLTDGVAIGTMPDSHWWLKLLGRNTGAVSIFYVCNENTLNK